MKIEIEENPSDDQINELRSILFEYNVKHLEIKKRKPLAVWYKNKILGGITGSTFGNWLEIKYFAVNENLRGAGIGAKLIDQIEKTAQLRGCKFSFLDTFSFQAKPFYENKGYKEVFCLEEYPILSKRHYLIKKLQS